MRPWILGLLALVVVAALGIYATETTVRVRQLQREDELAQQTLDRVERAVIRLDARLFGPVGQEDLSGSPLDGAPSPLPVDEAGKWSSVFVWPKDRQSDARAARLAWLFRSPRLQELLNQTIVDEHVADTSDPLWTDIYGKWFQGDEVQYWLIAPRTKDTENYGDVVYKVSGKNLPQSPEQLADDIQTMIDKAAARRPSCPRPFGPTPEPEPAPVAVTTNVQVPDVTPQVEEQPAGSQAPWGPVVAAGLMGLLVGYVLVRRFSN